MLGAIGYTKAKLHNGRGIVAGIRWVEKKEIELHYSAKI